MYNLKSWSPILSLDLSQNPTFVTLKFPQKIRTSIPAIYPSHKSLNICCTTCGSTALACRLQTFTNHYWKKGRSNETTGPVQIQWKISGEVTMACDKQRTDGQLTPAAAAAGATSCSSPSSPPLASDQEYVLCTPARRRLSMRIVQRMGGSVRQTDSKLLSYGVGDQGGCHQIWQTDIQTTSNEVSNSIQYTNNEKTTRKKTTAVSWQLCNNS